MLRHTRLLIGVVGMLLLVPQSALAATTNISMQDNLFSPQQAKVATGTMVHWTNDGANFHTTTGDDPLAFWDSGFISPGASFDVVFWGAGTFPYHCEIHSEMTGIVSVRPAAMPRSGPVGTQFTVRAGSQNAPAPYVFDIQRKDPGGGWATWLTNVTSKSSTFDSTGMPTGTYQFRVRTRDSSHGGSSKWSPAVAIQVTSAED
jgi:plastocyanin